MQITGTEKYHCTPNRMVIIKNDNIIADKDVEKVEPTYIADSNIT